MDTRTGIHMIGYGLFLFAMGIAGYLSNPEKAATALMSGGAFGSLSVVCGWLMLRGLRWARWAASGMTALLFVVFAWRASVSWTAVASGASEKLAAASIITLMGIASVAMLVSLLPRAGGPRRPGDGRNP